MTFSKDGTGAAGATVGVVVIGETPYAEGMGDRADLKLAQEDVDAVNNMKAAGIPVVVILFSGRPLILGRRARQGGRVGSRVAAGNRRRGHRGRALRRLQAHRQALARVAAQIRGGVSVRIRIELLNLC